MTCYSIYFPFMIPRPLGKILLNVQPCLSRATRYTGSCKSIPGLEVLRKIRPVLGESMQAEAAVISRRNPSFWGELQGCRVSAAHTPAEVLPQCQV